MLFIVINSSYWRVVQGVIFRLQDQTGQFSPKNMKKIGGILDYKFLGKELKKSARVILSG